MPHINRAFGGVFEGASVTEVRKAVLHGCVAPQFQQAPTNPHLSSILLGILCYPI